MGTGCQCFGTISRTNKTLDSCVPSRKRGVRIRGSQFRMQSQSQRTHAKEKEVTYRVHPNTHPAAGVLGIQPPEARLQPGRCGNSYSFK